ncbi:MAG: tetratricopeptide repeat protein [Bdellovibrionales bacterium]|nr:tetratricopeptide repeat protein [Bdellovibrionales bacterium]
MENMNAKKAMTFVVLAGSLLVTGCLQTRAGVKEQEEKQVLRKQVVNLQQTSADVSARFSEVDEEVRRVNGRTDTLDARMTQIKDRAEKNDFALEAKLKEQDTKLAAFREEMVKLQSEIAEVRASNQALQTAIQAGAAAASSGTAAAGATDKNPFNVGEAKFEQKAWRDAIFAYEDYRKRYPKGRSFTAATYKIGVSFQELGMIDDAKLFYEEVVAKAPKSKEAERARGRLKTLNAKKKK